MNEAVRHLIANPVVPLPTNWGSTSRDGAALSRSKQNSPKAKPEPYVPPHNRGGKFSGNKKVVAKVTERQQHHHQSTTLNNPLERKDVGIVLAAHVPPPLVVHTRVLRTFWLSTISFPLL
ncbi:hypothetical protein CYMTET_6957 [Cymbomonas tetramitiformis]|uniref:Uncharacterized protein n=1 Tax=Cymbomonas tetramitiformis TaxID=36881 RepID=A0AAE0GWI8_9CHLO|nr:hypothetical protein CYMTET_6957 [Cymbomonas tetramitiformis]